MCGKSAASGSGRRNKAPLRNDVIRSNRIKDKARKSIMTCAPYLYYEIFYRATIIPQAIFAPEFPAGWLVKSSGMECNTTVLPIISLAEKRVVRKVEKA